MALKERILLQADKLAEFKNIGDSVEGHYLGSYQFESKFRKGETKTAYVLRPRGSKTNIGVVANYDLTQRMNPIPVGNFVRIEFVETLDTGKGNPMKVFRTLDDDTDRFEGELITESSGSTSSGTTSAATTEGGSTASGTEESVDVDEAEALLKQNS